MAGWRLGAALLAACGLPSALGLVGGEAASKSSRAGPSRLLRASDSLGINEAVSYPLRLEARAAPTEERLAADAQATFAVGARWTRGHTEAWPRLSHDRWLREGRSFERMDTWVRVAQAAGLRQLAMIGPWPGNRTRQATSSYAIPDPEAYAAFVTAAVERYDGDGLDDMPGLRWPIDHWEIDNEPDLKNLVDLRTGETDDFATPEQVAAVIRLTARAIRAAHSDATVLGGGFFKITNDHGRDYMAALFAQEGVLDALDVVSVHAYHQGPGLQGLERTLDRVFAAAPGKRVRVTETSVPSEGRAAMSEVLQARLVIATWLTCLSRGVEQVYWHTLFDPPPTPGRQRPSGTRTNSLFARLEGGGLREKPAAGAYRELAALLAGVGTESIAEVPLEGGRAWRVGESTVSWPDGGPVRLVESTGEVRDLTR